MKLLQIQDNGCGIKVCPFKLIGGSSANQPGVGGIEIRPSDTRTPFHYLQNIQVLRPFPPHDIWIPWRGPSLHIARRQSDRRHQDEEGELCVEVRTPVFLGFRCADDPWMGTAPIFRASYVDGEMAPAQKGGSTDPKPCAGNDGTTIMVRSMQSGCIRLDPYSLYIRALR